jgi:hypothetical protein
LKGLERTPEKNATNFIWYPWQVRKRWDLSYQQIIHNAEMLAKAHDVKIGKAKTFEND